MSKTMQDQVRKSLTAQSLPPHLRIQYAIHEAGLCSRTPCCPFPHR